MVQKVVFILGNTGSGKSALAERLVSDRFVLFQIDRYYRSLPRTNTTIDLSGDEGYGAKIYKILTKDVLKTLEKKKDIIIEATGVSPELVPLYQKLKRNKSLEVIVIFVRVTIKNAKARISRRNKTKYLPKCSTSSLDYLSKILKKPIVPIDFFVDGNRSKKKVLQDTRAILNSTYCKALL